MTEEWAKTTEWKKFSTMFHQQKHWVITSSSGTRACKLQLMHGKHWTLFKTLYDFCDAVKQYVVYKTNKTLSVMEHSVWFTEVYGSRAVADVWTKDAALDVDQ